MCRAALALALQRTLEEDLYFCVQYCLMVPEVFHGLRDTMLGDFSPWLRPAVGYWFRTKMLRDLDGHVRPRRNAHGLLPCSSLRFADVASSPAQGSAALHSQLRVQGVGRHSYEFVRRRIKEELDMCSSLLKASGDRFLTGDTPTPADCYLFAIIDTVRIAPQSFQDVLGAHSIVPGAEHVPPARDLSAFINTLHLHRLRRPARSSSAAQTVHGFPPLEGDKFAFARLVKEQPRLMAFYARLKANLFPSGASDTFQKRAPF